MSCYTKETIHHDFMIASRQSLAVSGCIRNLEKTAYKILEDVPDNKARDMAISNLLKASNMIFSAYVLSGEG